MIKAAWDEYRGWANRARTLQNANGRWSVAALVCTLLAAMPGTLAGQADAMPWAGRALSFLAAAVAALTPVLGKDILDVKREAAWIRAEPPRRQSSRSVSVTQPDLALMRAITVTLSFQRVLTRLPNPRCAKA